MTRLFSIGSASLLLIAALVCAERTAVAQTSALDHKTVARKALENHIRKSYAKLTETFRALETQTGAFCAAPRAERLDTLRVGFADAVRSWGAIAHIVFGPVREAYRYERIWFWPDRKGIARRQVAGALRDRPQGYEDAAKLGEKSIAVQGMGAFEQILHSGEIDALVEGKDAQGFVCAYMKSIAGNLAGMSAEIENGWRDDAYGGTWLDPGPDNSSYLSDEETTFALLKALMEHLERVRDLELARPLGLSQSRRILPGPFSESGLTMAFIASRIAGLRSLFEESGLAEGLLKVASASGNVQAEADLRQILFELRIAETRAAELAEIPGILVDSTRRSEAIALGFPLKSLREMTASAAGRLTNLPVGFNASDGD